MRATVLALTLPALLLAACASAPPADPASLRLADAGPVSVSWADPARYSEFTCRTLAMRDGDWVRRLAEHVRSQGERTLPAGSRLDVRFNDIDRAGECEPSRSGQDFRVLRDNTPPRINLDYRYTTPAGEVREARDVRLIDLGYLQRTPSIPSTDALSHEKRLLDDWLRTLARQGG